jgi:hypothetical protein
MIYPAGSSRGQAGWDAAVPFEDLCDLAGKLASGLPMPKETCGNWIYDCDPVAKGEIRRLAINTHGVAGVVFVEGKTSPTVLSADTVRSPHLTDLEAIREYLHPAATVLFMGCLAGQGPYGTDLLKVLSRVWPGRGIVAFSTLGYRATGEMKRRGGNNSCMNPGVRETDHGMPTFDSDDDRRYKARWGDFALMPWASEASPYAKVVWNGVVTKWPRDELKPGSSNFGAIRSR